VNPRRWLVAWRRSRLGTRLALGLGALALVVFAVVGVVTVGIMRQYLDQRLDAQLVTSETEQLVKLQKVGGSPVPSYGWYSAVFEVSNGSAQPKPGSVLPPDLKGLASTALDAADGSVLRTVWIRDTGSYRVRACPLGPGEVLLSAASESDLDHTITQLIVVEVVAFLIALALLVIVGRIVLRRGLRPLSEMAGTAHDIVAHDLTESADLSVRAAGDGGGAEVEELRSAFNLMLAHIDTSLAARTAVNERLRRFVADASHELRTPLTSIRGYADLFRYAAANEPAERDAHLAKIREETARMSVLVDDLLLLARLDSTEMDALLRAEDVDVVQLVDAAASAFRAGRPDHPLTVGPGPSSVVLRADPARLRQVFDNLLANAAIHTADSTPVSVSTLLEGGSVLVRVIDEGGGIAAENTERIFDRFFRVDDSRNRRHGGSGLGLSVVRSLVEAHGGTVTVESRPGRTAFTVHLPLTRRAP
jgi:two-component system OmpR family sensor kinase